jgi:hypothetical protein
MVSTPHHQKRKLRSSRPLITNGSRTTTSPSILMPRSRSAKKVRGSPRGCGHQTTRCRYDGLCRLRLMKPPSGTLNLDDVIIRCGAALSLTASGSRSDAIGRPHHAGSGYGNKFTAAKFDGLPPSMLDIWYWRNSPWYAFPASSLYIALIQVNFFINNFHYRIRTAFFELQSKIKLARSVKSDFHRRLPTIENP